MPVLEAIWTLLTTPLTSFFIFGLGLSLWVLLKPLFTDPLKSEERDKSFSSYQLDLLEEAINLKERELLERERKLDEREKKLDNLALQLFYHDDDDDDEEEGLSLRLRIDRMNPHFRR